MSLNAARSHAWLADAYQWQHRTNNANDSFTSIPDGASSVSLLHLQSEDAMITDGSGDPEVASSLEKLQLRQHYARAPLQAADNEVALSDPSWQVVQHAQENANGARHGKRKLEPHSNHALDADVENGNLKKPRRVPEAIRAAVARGREDGGSSPMARLQEAAVGMVVEEEHTQGVSDGEPAPAPRRSARAQNGVRQ